jgi:hypothetical protein
MLRYILSNPTTTTMDT